MPWISCDFCKSVYFYSPFNKRYAKSHRIGACVWGYRNKKYQYHTTYANWETNGNFTE